MTHHLIDLAIDINKNKKTKSVIQSITEVYEYNKKNNSFEDHILVVIRSKCNIPVYFTFTSENAARNGLLTIKQEGKIDLVMINLFSINK